MKSVFYDTEDKQRFADTLKVWFKDSNAVEEIHRINLATDAAGNTSMSYSVMFYRYIDLRNKAVYDYKSFSDSAKIFKKARLPDSLMKDYGWSFYSEKIRQIQGTPEEMKDTIIDNVTYKRAKFHFMYDDPKRTFIIGYFRCDGKGEMFSLEKAHSRKLNCTMTKFSEFPIGKTNPFATIELEFLSDTLTEREVKVFEAWKKNAEKGPVSKH
jgi:hypothetical protein